MQRREFLQLSALGLAVAGLGPAVASASKKPGTGGKVQGVQLYTLRSLMERSVADTLALVAATGYRQVEFAGHFGHQPAELRRMLDGEGLVSPASHAPVQSLEENLAETLDAAAELGNRYLVLPWLDESQRNPDSYRRLTEQFNHWGEECHKAGIRFAYHNHEFEFESFDGFVPYHWMLDNTDPGLVSFEMDLFWMRKAGRDPLKYFKKHGGRFPLWHVKDMDTSGNMVDVGKGTIDFQEIIANADSAGYEYGFIEHDQPEDPAASIQASYLAVNSWHRG